MGHARPTGHKDQALKKFQFRLERLEKLRERVRRERRLSLAEALQYQERIEGQLAQLDEVRRQEKETLRARLSESVLAIEDVIRGHSFDGMLGRFSQQLGHQLDQVRKVVDQRRVQLQEAEKAVRMLEKLREKMVERYEDEVESNERQMFDEMAALAQFRQTRE